MRTHAHPQTPHPAAGALDAVRQPVVMGAVLEALRRTPAECEVVRYACVCLSMLSSDGGAAMMLELGCIGTAHRAVEATLGALGERAAEGERVELSPVLTAVKAGLSLISLLCTLEDADGQCARRALIALGSASKKKEGEQNEAKELYERAVGALSEHGQSEAERLSRGVITAIEREVKQLRREKLGRRLFVAIACSVCVVVVVRSSGSPLALGMDATGVASRVSPRRWHRTHSRLPTTDGVRSAYLGHAA